MTDRQRNLRIYLPVYLIFAVVYIGSGLLDSTFLSWRNNLNLFTRLTPLIFVSIAQTIVIIGGGIDLSVGAIIGLTNVIAASLPYVDTPANVLLWLLVPPLVGTMAGLVNGALIAIGKFPPIVATLGMSAVWQGIALFVMVEPGGEVSLAPSLAATSSLFGIIPVPLLLIVGVITVTHLFLTRTYYGRSLYALGGNELLAYESGIPIVRIKIWSYGLSGFFSSLAAIFLSAWMYSGDPLGGAPYVLDSIAVSVVGGNSLFMGRGGVLGLIGGAYVFRLLNNILNLIGVDSFYQYIAKGVVLVLALLATSSRVSGQVAETVKGLFGRRPTRTADGSSS